MMPSVAGARLKLLLLLVLGGVSCAWAGAWGVGAFDNDDALDWVMELEQSLDAKLLIATFDRIDAKARYIEAPECAQALAAAEVVAAAMGHASPSLPPEASKWIARVRPKITRELRETARAAVETCRNGKNSELRDLWLEGKGEDWLKGSADLVERLK